MHNHNNSNNNNNNSNNPPNPIPQPVPSMAVFDVQLDHVLIVLYNYSIGDAEVVV